MIILCAFIAFEVCVAIVNILVLHSQHKKGLEIVENNDSKEVMDLRKSFFLEFKEIERILMEIEMILISLHKMGSYYCEKNSADYEKETTRFIDENQVTHRLALIRQILTEAFDTQASNSEKKRIRRRYG